MSKSYLPVRDNDLGQWAQNFSQLLLASPASYGLTPADGAAIASYVSAFTAALAAVNNPATRTIASVATKDGAKAAMLATVRPYAMQIRNNLGVSNADKAAVGLRIVDQTKTPIAAPVTQPLINVLCATVGEHTLRFADVMTPDARRKPAGAVALQLFANVGAASNSDPAEARFRGIVTRQPHAVKYERSDNGKIATYFARWQNLKGETGPWSNAVSFTIVA